MAHHPDCEKYRKWKKEQAKKSKKDEKKEKKPKPKKILDCVDDDDEQQLPKVSHRKCKEKRVKRKISKKTTLYVLKRVSLTELALKKIKPSMEVRNLLLDPRHTACLSSSVTEMDMAMAQSAKSLMEQQLKRSRRKRKRRKKRTKKSAEKGDTKDDDGKSKDTIISESKKSKMSMKNGKNVEEDEDSEDECKSICSFDSQICLAGVKLTAEDRKKIKQYQREAEDANTQEKTDTVD